MPKKPLTPYFRFFMAKRQKYAAKHPKMGVTDLTKELSKKYADLSEKKKVSDLHLMTDWNGYWLVDWLVSWGLIDWLIGLLVVWLICWLSAWLVCFIDGWLIDQLVNWLTDWLNNWAINDLQIYYLHIVATNFRKTFKYTADFDKQKFPRN